MFLFMVTLYHCCFDDYVRLCRPTYSDLAEKKQPFKKHSAVQDHPKKLIGVKLLQLSTQLHNHKANVLPQWRFTPTI